MHIMPKGYSHDHLLLNEKEEVEKMFNHKKHFSKLKVWGKWSNKEMKCEL